MTDVARLRLAAQHVSTTPLARPEDIVARFGAMQAQDYLGALWAVGLRLRDAREPDVERALAEGRIVRTWPMRGTLHFVAARDVRWIAELLAPRAAAAAATRLRTLGLDDRTLDRARTALAGALAGGKRLTRPAAYHVLEHARVATAGGRGLHVLWKLAHELVLCFGPREGKQPTFVLADEWLPRTPRRAREGALAELARRYFTSHGPATVADFAWWSGLPQRDAREAIALAGDQLEPLVVGDRRYWRGDESLPRTRGRVYLLPAFDEWLVGYTDRTAALPARDARFVNNGGGILNPVIVAGARVVGTWKRRLARGRVVVEPAAFRTLPARREYAAAVARYARFLGVE
ncbi:MAG: winged helix DNA-binding domain-containing protein, partial [Acidobacteriota bacterium]